MFGYGSQGRAQALQLKGSGLSVCVSLYPESSSLDQARRDGFEVFINSAQAAQQADVAVILVPDEKQHVLYYKYLEDNLPKGATLVFAHGFSVAFDFIKPRKDLDVILVVPKCPGHVLLEKSAQKDNVNFLGAVYQNLSGKAREFMREYAWVLGGQENNFVETTFKEEAELNLFMEQAVSCGGLFHLIQAGFETLVENGYSSQVAALECLSVVKQIASLIEQDSLSVVLDKISPIARYGCVTRGPLVIDADVKKKMLAVLHSIQNKDFANEWIQETETGARTLKKWQEHHKTHPIEKTKK